MEIEQRVISGLVHLGEMIGIPARTEDAPISDLLRDIDAILETLIDELEKQQPQNVSSTVENSSSRVLAAAREANPAVSFHVSVSMPFSHYLTFASCPRPSEPRDESFARVRSCAGKVRVA